MERSKNHNFFISPYKSYKPSEEFSPYIMYKYGTGGKKMRKIPIKVPYNIWDKKRKEIKKSFVEKFSKEVQFIDEIKAKINSVSIDMGKGELTLENAFNELLDRSEDASIKYWIDNSKRLTRNTKEKYLSYLRAIEKHLSSEYSPLQFSHIQDPNSIDHIAFTLNNCGLGNGVNDYLRMLDTITGSKYANLKHKKPFSQRGLKRAKKESHKTPIKFKDVVNAFNDMRTTQDFMAVNFWLYSLSLRGLGGIDICNISEKNIIRGEGIKAEESILPYYPDFGIDKQWTGHLGEKIFLNMTRSKREKNKEMTILLNLFPSYLLHKSLRETLQRTHPQIAYKGEDRLRLFNFITHTGKEEVAKGKAKWKNLKDTIYPKLKRMGLAGVHRTRHTFIDTDQRLTDQEQSELLGHKAKGGSLHHYQSSHQIKTDLNHIKILEESRLMELIQMFYEVGYQRGFTELKPTIGAIQLLEKKKLTSFTFEDQLRLETLQKNYAENSNFKVFEGKVILTKGEKPQELIELEKKRKELYKPGTIHLDQIVSGDTFDIMTQKEIDSLQEEYNQHGEIFEELTSKC